MKKLRIIPLTLLLFFILIRFTLSDVNASGQLYIEDYDVEVIVNEDSTFDVSETISYRATGEFHRIYREITLEDKEAVARCHDNPTLQCGGFSYVTVTGVYDSEGEKVPENDYTLENITYISEDRLKVQWEYAPNGKYFDNELFTWTIKYKVYGGLGYFDDYDLFYWDVFYPDRDYEVENADFSISFPKDINFTDDDLKVLYQYDSYTYDYSYDDESNTLYLEAEDLSAYEDFTVLLKFPKDIVQQYAALNLDLKPEEQDFWIDGIEILNVSETFIGIPPGNHDFKFTASGYEPQEFSFTLSSGETKDLKVHLEMTLGQKLIYLAIVAGNVLSCFGGIGIIGLVIMNYYNKGRDKGGRKTIVPWFKPPDGISPVIVGSIKDEKVHMVDITSTIINAAVRGFIKIKEVGKKKYKLIKLKNFEVGDAEAGRRIRYEVLDFVEVKILKDIFATKSEVETDDLKNRFYMKINGINNEIYSEMVKRQYFDKRPDKVRNKHLGLAIFMIVAGGVLSFILPMFVIFTCGPSLVVAGVVKMIFSFFMPAKTPKGTIIYEKCKGFRMFLHTTERFKLQKLTPEKFERFLPYAMVFGVEKQWAKNFKDIYTKPPNWYEGRSPGTTFNTIYLVNSLSRMNSGVGRVMASSPRSSSSSGWSGGGWSGGGGFSGGFSGGGGGGGGGGMS